jgi:hypothetical protein
VEIQLVLPAVSQIKEAHYELVSPRLVFTPKLKLSVQSLSIFESLGVVPDLLQ